LVREAFLVRSCRSSYLSLGAIQSIEEDIEEILSEKEKKETEKAQLTLQNKSPDAKPQTTSLT